MKTKHAFSALMVLLCPILCALIPGCELESEWNSLKTKQTQLDRDLDSLTNQVIQLKMQLIDSTPISEQEKQEIIDDLKRNFSQHPQHFR